MKLAHKKPCSECPWRRKHVPGWLGGYPAETFTNQVQFNGPPVPCHKTLEDGSKGEAMCAGALIMMKNSCKSAQHPDYGDALEHIERDTISVFSFPHEFLQHHAQNIQDWMQEENNEAAR